MDVTAIALSGLNAAEKRLANSANNIANATTNNFVAKEVKQTALQTGGVRADVIDRSPVAQAAAGEDKPAEVSLEKELVDAQLASYDFQANIKMLKVQKELDKSLFDLQA